MILTLYLIHVNVYNSVHAPRGRGFSYIEVWMMGTQIPMLLALTEYGFVLYWKKVAKKTNQVQQKDGNDLGSVLDEKIKKLDLISMISSFLYFILFTLFYVCVTN